MIHKASNGRQAHVSQGLSAGESRNDEPALLTFRTRSNKDVLASPKNIHQASSLGSFALHQASVQDEYWTSNTPNPRAESRSKQVAPTTPSRPTESLRQHHSEPHSTQSRINQGKGCGSAPTKELHFHEKAQDKAPRKDNKEVSAHVVEMSISSEKEANQKGNLKYMIQSFDQFFKTSEQMKKRQGFRDNVRSITPIQLHQRSLLQHCL